MTCRICYEPGETISVCACSGSVGHVHLECIQKWIYASKRQLCEICGTPFSHPQLKFPMSAENIRLHFACVYVSLLGLMNGFLIWMDTLLHSNNILGYIMLCIFFNIMQMVLVMCSKIIRHRYWQVHVLFMVGFIAGNLPGHIVQWSMSSDILLSYAFNIICLSGFLAVEHNISLFRRRRLH